MQVADRLRPVFVSALELTPDVDVSQLRYREHPRWDSLGHLALVLAIEDEFDVEFDTEHLLGMDSFGAALKILGELGVSDAA